jgi:hypothetical protein
MIDVNDPSYREILDDFIKESLTLLNDLDAILLKIEKDQSQIILLEKFGQIIDRIMGASKSLNMHDISNYCELGKLIGYKCSQIDDKHKAIIPFVIPILSDAIVLLKKMMTQLQKTKQVNLKEINLKAFGSRLKWLSEKFKFIDRSSCKDTDHNDKTKSFSLNQVSIDDLLQNLGL